VRESVAIKLVKLLAPMVKHIYAYEPIAKENAIEELKNLKNISYVDSSLEAIRDSHFLVIATEYSQFWNVSPEHFLQLKDKCIFDGRNILDKNKIESIGIHYFGIGR
jgi:UDPglucose 6-dehydrogenase